MSPSSIFHIAEPARWHQAQADGSYTGSTRGSDLRGVGFIHCSYRHQVEAVANHLYADWSDELLLLEADPEKIPAEIRVERLDGAPDEFPHIYGPLPTAAVSAVHTLTRQADGWVLPGGGPSEEFGA